MDPAAHCSIRRLCVTKYLSKHDFARLRVKYLLARGSIARLTSTVSLSTTLIHILFLLPDGCTARFGSLLPYKNEWQVKSAKKPGGAAEMLRSLESTGWLGRHGGGRRTTPVRRRPTWSCLTLELGQRQKAKPTSTLDQPSF